MLQTAKYGNDNLGSLGPQILNSLPSKIKEETEYEKFKNYMNDWFGVKCRCNLCSFSNRGDTHMTSTLRGGGGGWGLRSK